MLIKKIDEFDFFPINSKKKKDQKNMKIGASVRKICQRCRLVRRRRQLTVICPNLKHKKRQG